MDPTSPIKNQTQIKRAMAYVQLNYKDTKLGIHQIAHELNLSADYFRQLFKQVSGMNFPFYLNQIRIIKAQEKLKQPDLRISEIAYSIGYESLEYFGKVFKKFTGMTPTHFRRLTRLQPILNTQSTPPSNSHNQDQEATQSPLAP